MVKEGPCYHCGVTSTPLWRNGPPEKPVLCNACGSRWRTKGTLTNYAPLHSREPFCTEELKPPMVKPQEHKSHKKRQSDCNIKLEQKRVITDSDQSFQKFLEEDTSNWSSSGSAISYSESCSHFGGTDASDLTGQSNVWDSLVPSRKRTCIIRPKPSPVEKLTRDLCSILHQQSSYLSGSSEEDLLYETETPMGSLEIGHGGILIRHPNSGALEEESEASSLPVENKPFTRNGAYAVPSKLPLDVESKGPSFPILGDEKFRKTLTAKEFAKRDNMSREMFQILGSRDSPLSYVDLKEIINFEGFMRHLTHEEKQELMKYLPSIDAARPPESLSGMFCSRQFLENLSYFRQLLLEGIFDLSFSCLDMDECKILKKLVLVNFMKSKWIEHYTKLKDKKGGDIIGRKAVCTGPNSLGSSNIIPFKRPHDIQKQNFLASNVCSLKQCNMFLDPEKMWLNWKSLLMLMIIIHAAQEKKTMIRSPRRSCHQGVRNLDPPKPLQLNFGNHGMRSINDTDESIENDTSSSSPRSFFARSSVLDSLQFSDESSDQGLLLDVRSNASFLEAELLCDTWKQSAATNSQSAESGIDSILYNPA